MIPLRTPKEIMAYQSSGLFLCALMFAATQMLIPAVIALLICFVGLFYQYRLKRNAPAEHTSKPTTSV